MLSSYEQLLKVWSKKHFNHLVWCLENNIDYYEGAFKYGGVGSRGYIVINDRAVSINELVYTLAIYHEDDTKNYQTAFRDFIYLCFTDLVTDDVDILEEALEN